MYNVDDFKYLSKIEDIADFKKLKLYNLTALAKEIRTVIIETVSNNGGHLASNLGVVELSMMMHYCFDSPNDKFIFDVGHQCYTHKILTGRLDKFSTIRKQGGLSGFPKSSESIHDIAETGHASTSLSVGLGVEVASKYRKQKNYTIALIGDGSMTGGLALEAINNISHIPNNLIVIVNNNEMSIGNNIGAISKALNNKINDKRVQELSSKIKEIVSSLPLFGFLAKELIKRLEGAVRSFIAPGIIFRDMGFKYFGPVDGHNIKELHKTFNQAKLLNTPILIHVNTQKGMGYSIAQEHLEKFHGTAPFDIKTGIHKHISDKKTFSALAGDILLEAAESDEHIMAITAAMTSGTGISGFAEKYQDRFFDVGIAEGHAASFAAGLAINGIKPILFLYSTFLQRAYDQVIHDIALMNLHVVIMIDRAGVVGDDGETHQGIFDVGYLRIVPNITIFAPTNDIDFKAMFDIAIKTKQPFVLRYPKEYVPECTANITTSDISIGKAFVINEGKKGLIISYSSTVDTIYNALQKTNELKKYTFINLLSLKPLDEETLIKYMSKHSKAIVIEEACSVGSMGSAILELANKNSLKTHIGIHGIDNAFLETATRAQLLQKYKLNEYGIINTIDNFFNTK